MHESKWIFFYQHRVVDLGSGVAHESRKDRMFDDVTINDILLLVHFKWSNLNHRQVSRYCEHIFECRMVNNHINCFGRIKYYGRYLHINLCILDILTWSVNRYRSFKLQIMYKASNKIYEISIDSRNKIAGEGGVVKVGQRCTTFAKYLET